MYITTYVVLIIEWDYHLFFVLGRNTSIYTCFSIVFAWLRAEYSSATDDHPLKIMGQVFVLWTNTLSKSWGKYSCCGRIPCQDGGASIRPWTNSTYSTNVFPKYSSNLFVFVRGVQSWVSTIQSVVLTADVFQLLSNLPYYSQQKYEYRYFMVCMYTGRLPVLLCSTRTRTRFLGTSTYRRSSTAGSRVDMPA